MPNHPNHRLLIRSKLKSKRVSSLAGIQNCENARSTAIVGKISALHGIWEVASNDVLDLLEPTSAASVISRKSQIRPSTSKQRKKRENHRPHSILPSTRRQETLISSHSPLIQRQHVHLRCVSHIIPRIRLCLALQPQRDVQWDPIRASLEVRRASCQIIPAKDIRRMDVDHVERRVLLRDSGFGAVQRGDFGRDVSHSAIGERGWDFWEAIVGVVGQTVGLGHCG